MRPLKKKKKPGALQVKYGVNFETNIQLTLELEMWNELIAEELSDANHPLSKIRLTLLSNKTLSCKLSTALSLSWSLVSWEYEEDALRPPSSRPSKREDLEPRCSLHKTRSCHNFYKKKKLNNFIYTTTTMKIPCLTTNTSKRISQNQVNKQKWEYI